MPNSARKSRRRPREKSVSFLSLWFVVARQAAWLLLDDGQHCGTVRQSKGWIVRSELTVLHRACASSIANNPRRIQL
jgi:hypothetical protein